MPLRIVYLDDEPQLCIILKEMLESAEVTIVTFTDAEEAIRSIEAQPPDLVFLDFRLANTTGDKVAARLDSRIPKALLTGDSKMKDLPPFIRVFFKPFDFDEIEAFLHEFQEQRRSA